MRQFDDKNTLSPRFFFLFDENLVFKKARIEQVDVGHFDFTALIPFQEVSFEPKDWLLFDCDKIEEEILEEHNNFVSFTRQLIIHLLGEEDDILSLLGYNTRDVNMGKWL